MRFSILYSSVGRIHTFLRHSAIDFVLSLQNKQCPPPLLIILAFTGFFVCKPDLSTDLNISKIEIKKKLRSAIVKKNVFWFFFFSLFYRYNAVYPTVPELGEYREDKLSSGFHF